MFTQANILKYKLCTVVVLSALLGAGCSGSSSATTSGESQDAPDQNAQDQASPESNTTNALVGSNDSGTSDAGTSESTSSDSSSSDSSSSQLATIPVTFDITVPKYVSAALQVRVQWADMDTNASWVRDESWTVSSELPTNTESQLVVTFNDGNGAITLGRVEAVLKTNSTGFQLVDINASQFDTSQFDDDSDGVSNLNELLQGTTPSVIDLAAAVQPSYELVPAKTIRLSWPESEGAQYYRVLANLDGVSGFEQISADIAGSEQSFDHRVPLYDIVNASYILQACNVAGCVDSNALQVSGTLAKAVGYFKASATDRSDLFGASLSISADGQTLAVGAMREESNAIGINGDDTNNTLAGDPGAVYVFAFLNNAWVQQAYVKASSDFNSGLFGSDVGLSADGNTLVVGAREESRGGSGIDPDRTERLYRSGAAYVFGRNSGIWEEEAYLKASNPGRIDYFGFRVAISADGDTVAVAADREGGMSAGVNGDQANIDTHASGAVYLFERSGSTWKQHAYVKASNPDHGDLFGRGLSLSADGKTLAVSAVAEESQSTGINGDQSDNSVADFYGYGLGAVYLYRRNNENWYQEAYIKASNGEEGDKFGSAVGLSANGNVLVVGARDEDSVAVGVDGVQTDNTAENSGAAYVFEFSDGNWTQQAYLKASNTQADDEFGSDVDISDDGNTLVVGATHEDSAARGINDRQDSETDFGAGAVYVFTKESGAWQQKAYVKASNTDRFGYFGSRVSLSGDGKSLAVGSYGEASASMGINGDQLDNSLKDAGAVYLY